MAATCPASFDVALLRRHVRETYTALAEEPGGDFHFHRGAAYAVALLGYDAAELSALPGEATDAFAGVGRPLAGGTLRRGAIVLDHACGAGTDLLLAARRVGPTGYAIGVDLTAAMVARARRAASLASITNIDITQSPYEALPVPDASVDVVLSNGVLNLAPDKPLVLAEVARVLRSGGELWIADVVVQRELTLGVRSDAELWAACVAGALPEAELVSLLATDFTSTRLVARHDCFRGTSSERRAAGDLHIGAITVAATRR